MELRINLATASLKDAEHAIFLIGAYFGMTNLPRVPAGNTQPVGELVADSDPNRAPVVIPPAAFITRTLVQPEPDPAQVFGGNVAAGALAPVGAPALPTAAPSAPNAAGPVNPTPAPTAAGPVGTAPAPPPAPVASAPQGVELDVTGLPWDPRIHASGEGGTKPKNADGKWRKKRGLNDEALIHRIEAELRATMAAPAAGTPPAVMPPPPTPAPTAPPAVVPQPPAAQVDPQTFEQLMPRVTAAVMAGTIPQGALLQAVTAYALPNIMALAQRPDLVPSVWAYLRSMYPNIV